MAHAKPILVTGAHRSGTTWVGRILDASPATHYVHEPFNPDARPSAGISRFRPPYWYAYVTERNEAGVLESLRDTVSFRYRVGAALRETCSLAGLGRVLRERALVRDARRRGARALIKDPIALLSAEWLARRLGSDVVVMIRHPAAFVASVERVGWWFPFEDLAAQADLLAGPLAEWADEVRRYARGEGDPIERAAFGWRVLYSVVAGYRRRHPEWVFLWHEDLARDPERRFEGLFAQLGVPWDEAVRAAVLRSSDPSNPREAPAGEVLALERDSRGLVEQWRDRLSRDDLERVRRLVEPLASELGFGETW